MSLTESCPSPSRFAAVLLAGLLSCADGAGEDLPPMTLERVTRSLITDPDLRQVLAERADAPVEASIVVPLGQWQPGVRRGSGAVGTDAGALPALRMAPPAEVAFHLPPGPPDARLAFAAGIDQAGYATGLSGEVRFEVELDGRVVFDAVLGVGDQVPREERRWRRGEESLERGGRVVLRTTRVGGQDVALPAAFGLLQVRQEIEIPRSRASVERPNVVCILIDTLRADGLHSYGNPLEVSPVLDALAARGELFEQAYAPSSWTWPSTASLLTGQLPEEHGFEGPDSCHLSDELVTLAEAFQQAGFTTAGFSCNPLVARSKNLDQGFETFREFVWAHTRDVEDEIVAWLDEMGSYRFFLYLHLIDPHSPNAPDPDLAQSMIPEDLRAPVLGRAGLIHNLGRLATGQPADMRKLNRHAAHLKAFYDAEILTVDRAIGRLLGELERRGLTEQTVVAVTSDHGQEFLEHGQFGHGAQVHEESVRVPLILAGPGVERGRRHAGRVENRHLGRTLFELAGIEPPAGNLAGPGRLHSSSTDPVFLSTATGTWFDPQTGELTGGGVRGLLHGDLLLHRCEASVGGGEGWLRLYDLSSDPQAQVDVSAERPEETARLLEQLERHLERAAEVRPTVLGGGDAARAELRAHGYLGGDDEEE